MRNFNFIFLRLTFYLIAGILSCFYFSPDLNFSILLGGISIAVFLFSWFRAQKQIFTDLLPGIATFLLIFSLGLSITYFAIPQNQKRHYKRNTEAENSMLEGNIVEELKSTSFNRRYFLEAQKLINKDGVENIKGKILLNVQNDSVNNSSIRPGDKIILPFIPKEINSSINPFQFNYRAYMSHLKVEKQISIKASDAEIFASGDQNLLSTAWNFREYLISKLKNKGFSKDQLAIFQALILGKRSDINDEQYKSYAAAGAIHILAISGLHIGILLLLLNYLFKPLENLRNGRLLKTIVLISLLWAFAVITGLSPSVVRAVTMFSFVAVGMQIKRKTSILNSIFLSLFFLLLIDPYYIFQAGFQLSYLAILGIVIFQPFIYKLFNPAYPVFDYFWKLISVSIAAQIGVLPLSLFYFHQFPGLFLLSNIVILPLLGIILIGGLLIILLAALDLLPAFLGNIYAFLLELLNQFVLFVADIKAPIITNISFSFLQMISAYLFILSFIILLKKRKFIPLVTFLLSIVIFQASTLYKKVDIPYTEALVFHKSRQTAIATKEGQTLNLFKDKNIELPFVQDYVRERNVQISNHKNIPSILDFAGQKTIIIDSSGIYNIPDFRPEIIILRNSPKINPERLISNLMPKQIVADGSNYLNYIEMWKRACRNKKIPFHYTGEKGAYVLTKN